MSAIMVPSTNGGTLPCERSNAMEAVVSAEWRRNLLSKGGEFWRDLMAKVLMAVVVCWVFVSLLGCKQQDIKMTLDERRPDIPFAFIWRTPAYPGPGQEMICGLIAAVWQDGRIVRVESEKTIGRAYIEGKLTDEQLVQTIHVIETSGVLRNSPPTYLIVDAPCDRLVLHTRRKLIRWAHTPGSRYERPEIRRVKEYLLRLTPASSTQRQWPTDYPDEWMGD